MKAGYWIGFAIVLWLVLVIATIPAGWAVYVLQQVLPNWRVAAADIDGSIWYGSVGKAQLIIDDKPLTLNEFKWQSHLSSLLWLEPCISLSARSHSPPHSHRQSLSVNVCVSLLSGRLQLRHGQANISVSALEPWLLMRLRGNASVSLKSMIISRDGVKHIDGALTWRQAQFHNSRHWIDLGELQVQLADDRAGGLRGQLTDVQQGPIAATLTIEAPKKGGLSVSGKVVPKATAQQAIHETLRIIGKLDSNDGYLIDWHSR